MNNGIKEWQGKYYILLDEDKLFSERVFQKFKYYEFFPSFIAHLDWGGSTMRFVQYTDEEEKIAKYIFIPYDWIKVMIPMDK